MNKKVTMRSEAKLFVGLFFSVFLAVLQGHGRLIEPPSRASAWRFGFQTPPDYNDHELYCGGLTRQWKINGGRCGECGDAWDIPEPRPHEYGGQWGQGLVVRSYTPGSKITIRVELTASHMGYFEFRVCPNKSAKQSCLDENVLQVLNGSPSRPNLTDLKTRFYPRNGSCVYEMQALLPDFTCDQCVLQWRYVAGNNWGMCTDGNGAVGCGPQEEFRSCSDIAIISEGNSPIVTSRPVHRKPTQSIRTPTTTEQNVFIKTSKKTRNAIFLLTVIVFAIFAFAVGIWYFYNNSTPFGFHEFLCILKTKNYSWN